MLNLAVKDTKVSSDVRILEKCRICGGTHFEDVLSLGALSLTGVFPRTGTEDPLYEELNLILCTDCKFLQLDRSVNSDLMYKEYWYRSGTNQTMRDHLTAVVKNVTSLIDLTEDDYCIDIGCNDGTLLKSCKELGIKSNLIGYDPSNAIHDITDPDITAINDYFNATAFKNKFAGKKAKLITSISMFYDLDNPHKFISDIKECLAEGGIWVVEVNYTLKMLTHLGFDMISHEHVSYYTFSSFERLMNMNGMYINDVSFNEMNGGNVCFYVSRSQNETPRVQAARQKELDAGINKLDIYKDFADRVRNFKTKVTNYLTSLAKDGNKVAAYGASTRGNTILQYCGIKKDTIFAAADRNPMKWGLETSGSRIPIVSEDEVRKIQPDYLVSLPYYFVDEFLKREEAYLKAGGKMVFLLPSLIEVSWDNTSNKPEVKEIANYNV